MSDTDRLDGDASELLARRIAIGMACMNAAAVNVTPDDRWTAAKDAISDVITAAVGPAGTCVEVDGRWEVVKADYHLNEARRLIEEAFRGWEGDAEDYTAPEGG